MVQLHEQFPDFYYSYQKDEFQNLGNFFLMFESYAADKNYKRVKNNFRSLKMYLNVSDIVLQVASLAQKRVLASVDTSVFSELNLKTSEGDLVRFAFSEEASLSESLSQMQTRENDT